MEPIRIQMLGRFALQTGQAELSDQSNRSRKVWCLLAYLICSRERPVSQKILIDLLWGDEADSMNPENALRITLHRLRAALDGLGEGMGRRLIQYKDGGYRWNPEVPVELDCDRFEELAARPETGSARLALCLEALALYRGEFLPRQGGELWVIPLANHYHERFIQLTMEAAGLLRDAARYGEAADLCRKAVAAESYHEPLHQLLMRCLGDAGDSREAAAVYEGLRKRLFDDFGIQPSEETRVVYRMVAHSPEERTLPIEEVMGYLQEAPGTGALVCDYDYFKILCFAESRSMTRSGSAAHVALLDVTAPDGGPVSRQRLDRVMVQLEQQLQKGLRRGDALARCSVSQYVLMLPGANYEDSGMVCRRLLAAFHKAHPRAAVQVSYSVQPLIPSLPTP